MMSATPSSSLPSPASDMSPFTRFMDVRPAPAIAKHESDLLRSIRTALRGTDTEPSGINTVKYESSGPDGILVKELCWDARRVVVSAGGVVLQQWSFAHEGEPVRWACVGWLEQAGIVAAARSSGHYTSEFHAGPSRPADASERPTFGPFARAEQARKRALEPAVRVRATFVFLRSIGKIFLESGIEYTFALPFIVRRAWPLHPHGVLVQRVLDATEIQEAEMTDDEPLPTVFSLTSPLAEPAVVGVAEGIVGGFHSVPPSLVNGHHDDSALLQSIPPKESVVWVSSRACRDDDDVVVTVDAEQRRLSIWRYTHIKPKDAPMSQSRPSTRKKRASMHGGAGDRRHSMGGNNSFDWAAAPSINDHPLEKSPTADTRKLPPLSALPGMPPSLSTTTTMASLVAGEPPPGAQLLTSPPPKARRNSLGRKELGASIDRIALGGRPEVDASLPPTEHTRMKAAFWVSKLHSMDIPELE